MKEKRKIHSQRDFLWDDRGENVNPFGKFVRCL